MCNSTLLPDVVPTLICYWVWIKNCYKISGGQFGTTHQNCKAQSFYTTHSTTRNLLFRQALTEYSWSQHCFLLTVERWDNSMLKRKFPLWCDLCFKGGGETQVWSITFMQLPFIQETPLGRCYKMWTLGLPAWRVEGDFSLCTLGYLLKLDLSSKWINLLNFTLRGSVSQRSLPHGAKELFNNSFKGLTSLVRIK